MIARLLDMFEAAVETVINAAVDRIVDAWIEAGDGE
jgi:Na+/H+-dicarboxylate symporter